MTHITVEESSVSKFLFSSTYMAWFWLVVRVYVGWQWLHAGWEKMTDPAWIGSGAGSAMSGFIKGALGKTGGAHPDVPLWYASFLRDVVLAHITTWSHVIAYGETLVGAALILGVLTGIAAFFGSCMNLNYLLAGTVSINPVLFALGIGLVCAWKIAGYIGGDRYVLPRLFSSWRKVS